MNYSDNILSKDELEELCRAFMEGELTLKEEQSLSRILSTSEYNGGIIDETIFLMGIGKIAVSHNQSSDLTSSAEKEGISGNALKVNNFRDSLKKILSVSAAAAAVIAIATFGWNHLSQSKDVSNDTVFAAYVGGEEENNPEKAKMMALAEYDRSIQFLERMQALQEKELKDAEQLNRIYDDAVNKVSELTSNI